ERERRAKRHVVSVDARLRRLGAALALNGHHHRRSFPPPSPARTSCSGRLCRLTARVLRSARASRPRAPPSPPARPPHGPFSRSPAFPKASLWRPSALGDNPRVLPASPPPGLAVRPRAPLRSPPPPPPRSPSSRPPSSFP